MHHNLTAYSEDNHLIIVGYAFRPIDDYRRKHRTLGTLFAQVGQWIAEHGDPRQKLSDKTVHLASSGNLNYEVALKY